MACKSFMSSSNKPWSSAILNTSVSTPVWVSFRFKIRLNRSGPISLTVARTGCPCLPNTSQNTTVQPENFQSLSPRVRTRSSNLVELFPA